MSLLDPLDPPELLAVPLESAVPSLLASVAVLLELLSVAVAVTVVPLDELSPVAETVPVPLDSAVVDVPVAVSVVVVELPLPVDVSSPPQPVPEPIKTIVITHVVRMLDLHHRA